MGKGRDVLGRSGVILRRHTGSRALQGKSCC